MEARYIMPTRISKMAVKNQWNGIVEWNTGMEYWNGLINAKNLSYFINTWINDEDNQQGYQFARMDKRCDTLFSYYWIYRRPYFQ